MSSSDTGPFVSLGSTLSIHRRERLHPVRVNYRRTSRGLAALSVVLRHLGYVDLLRQSIDDSEIYGAIERFARQFADARGFALETLPILVGHEELELNPAP